MKRLSVRREDLALEDALIAAGKSFWIPGELAGWRPPLPNRVVFNRPRRATARREAHIGEVFQGAITLGDWPTDLADPGIVATNADILAVPILVDLPAPCLFSEASCAITPGTGRGHIEPADRTKALAAARLVLQVFGVAAQVDVEVRLASNIRSARGNGGSSTDVGVTIEAVARALGCRVPVAVMDFLTVVAERASNPSYRGPGIFLQRAGVMPWQWPSWPPMRILGCDDSRAPDIVTDSMTRARYSSELVETFDLMLRGLVTAVQQGDIFAIGRFMEMSAEINEMFLPRNFAGGLAALREIRESYGAVGVAVSHSGTVAALAWPEDSSDVDDAVDRAEHALREYGYDVFWNYTLH